MEGIEWGDTAKLMLVSKQVQVVAKFKAGVELSNFLDSPR